MVHKPNRKASVIAAALFLICFLLLTVCVGCPIKYLTGISCPGCGMTRAIVCAFRLDFASAFVYHPLWPALPIAVLLLALFFLKRNRKGVYAVLTATVILLCAVYVYRLVLTDSAVVAWDIPSGILYRLFAGG